MRAERKKFEQVCAAICTLIVTALITPPAWPQASPAPNTGTFLSLAKTKIPGEEFGLEQLTRTAGMFSLKNKAGQKITVHFSGSTHDWDDSLRVVDEEMSFLKRTLDGEIQAKDLVAEQAGDGLITDLLEQIIVNDQNLSSNRRTLLLESIIKHKLTMSGVETEKLAELSRGSGRRVINGDLVANLNAIDYVFRVLGPTWAQELVYGSLYFIFSDVDSKNVDEQRKSELLKIGDQLLQGTAQADYFKKFPFSKHSRFAKDKSGAFIEPTEFSDEQRDRYFAKVLSESESDVCLVAHTSHILGALKFLSSRMLSFQLLALEPNRELRQRLLSNSKECELLWPSTPEANFKCSARK